MARPARTSPSGPSCISDLPALHPLPLWYVPVTLESLCSSHKLLTHTSGSAPSRYPGRVFSQMSAWLLQLTEWQWFLSRCLFFTRDRGGWAWNKAWSNGAGEMAHRASVKTSLSSQASMIKKEAWRYMRANPVLERGRQADPGASLASQPSPTWQAPGPGERLCQRTKWMTPKEQHLISSLHIHTDACVSVLAHTCVPTQAYIHSHPKSTEDRKKHYRDFLLCHNT